MQRRSEGKDPTTRSLGCKGRMKEEETDVLGHHAESSGSKSNSLPVWLHGVASLKKLPEGQGTDAEPKSWPSVWEVPNGLGLSGAGNAPTGPATSLLGPAGPGFCPHPARPAIRWLGNRATVLPYALLPAVDASRSPHWLWGCSGTQIPTASVTSQPLYRSPSPRRPRAWWVWGWPTFRKSCPGPCQNLGVCSTGNLVGEMGYLNPWYPLFLLLAPSCS